jgi:hypothetical protein
MALRGRAARSITVDGARYQWVASAPEAPYCLDVWVQSASGEGQKLHARVSYGEAHGAQTTSVTPNIIARLVREALSLGWQPKERGPDFRHWKA